MQEYHMEILYCKGSNNVASTLSRVMNMMSFLGLENSSLHEIKEAQLEYLSLHVES